MGKKVASRIILQLLLVSITIAATLRIVAAPTETTLYVDPKSIIDATLTPGSTFTVSIMVSDVQYLYDWVINMSWNPNVLFCVNTTEGDFLKSQPEGTWWASRIQNDKGLALFACTTIGVYVGKSGSGRLATVEFGILAKGESPIKIDNPNTVLEAQTSPVPPPNFEEISFVAENGYFSNLSVKTLVFFNINPNPATRGQTITLKGVLIDWTTKPLANETVRLYVRPIGGDSWIYITSLWTDTYGIFTCQGTIPWTMSPSAFLIAVYYPGSGIYESTYNFAVLIIQ